MPQKLEKQIAHLTAELFQKQADRLHRLANLLQIDTLKTHLPPHLTHLTVAQLQNRYDHWLHLALSPSVREFLAEKTTLIQ
ncbi:hypothetical protein [Trichothermofontia sp.]